MIFLVKPFVADTTKHWTQQVYIFLQSVNVSEFPTADTKSDSLLPKGLGVALALKQAQLNSILFNTDIQFDY